MGHQHISDKVKEMTLHVLPRPPWLRGLQVHRNQFAMHQVCVTHLSPDWWSLDSLGDFGVTLSVSDTGASIFLSCSLPFLTLSYCTTSVWRHSVIIIVSDTSPHPWTLHLTSGLTFCTSHSPHVFVCRLHLFLRLFFYFFPTSIFSLTIFNFNVPIRTTLGTDCDVYKTFSFGSLMSLNSQPMISHHFHRWWISWHPDHLIIDGPTDAGRSSKLFWDSWVGRIRLRVPESGII